MHGEMSDKIRAYAEHNYVVPARRDGRNRFSIAVRDVLDFFVENEGLPRQNVPQVCQALRTPRKFLNPLGLILENVDGPEKQQSPTVVFHYRFLEGVSGQNSGKTDRTPGGEDQSAAGSPIDRLWGLLREELSEYGGGEAFLRQLRTDPEKDRR
jgi:hypothetical protein